MSLYMSIRPQLYWILCWTWCTTWCNDTLIEIAFECLEHAQLYGKWMYRRRDLWEHMPTLSICLQVDYSHHSEWIHVWSHGCVAGPDSLIGCSCTGTISCGARQAHLYRVRCELLPKVTIMYETVMYRTAEYIWMVLMYMYVHVCVPV